MTSLPGHFDDVGSREVIFCHVTATSCELQPSSGSNVPKTWLIGLLQPLPGEFRSTDDTSGSLQVTRGHVVISFNATVTFCELQV